MSGLSNARVFLVRRFKQPYHHGKPVRIILLKWYRCQPSLALPSRITYQQVNELGMEDCSVNETTFLMRRLLKRKC